MPVPSLVPSLTLTNAGTCDIFRLKTLCVYHVAMVLGGNIYSSGLQVFNRMIAASVTIFHLMGICARCKSHQLMSKTDCKDRHIRIIEFFDLFDNGRTFLRISRAVGLSMMPSGLDLQGSLLQMSEPGK